MPKGFIIAIDGPAASGKGAIALALAKDLNGFYLYTGAMYRCLALICIERGLDLERENEVESALTGINIQFENNQIMLNGSDVSERIKQADTASGASKVGVYPKVRESLDQKLREIATKVCDKGQIVVTEGRDTATTIFPSAVLKIYLSARPEIRAKRRMEQYIKKEKDLSKELQELKVRDKRDKERLASPLASNPQDLGYFVLDNSDMTESETLNVIKKELKKRELIND